MESSRAEWAAQVERRQDGAILYQLVYDRTRNVYGDA